jgi:hypothetical protein
LDSLVVVFLYSALQQPRLKTILVFSRVTDGVVEKVRKTEKLIRKKYKLLHLHG